MPNPHAPSLPFQMRNAAYSHHAVDRVRSLNFMQIQQIGILGGACGENGIRLRPALIFEPKHANIYLDALRSALKDLSK
ncbi:4-aminobutyrate aminotransferase [Eumeta japonica]|uniref:4-aminobutyrate aminotransferase n=1 Tax=Eumeta variegata TaxID=151549 RepID=A0A4C1UWL8_EUMVA|nr:4-aminobutyrate aminotransferase [Eumeta japonica]